MSTKPMTVAEYNVLTPQQQGYVTYMRAEWPKWKIPKENPYKKNSTAYKEWNQGQHNAVITCIDLEE